MSAGDHLPVKGIRLTIREWTSPEGTRVRFRQRDANANRDGRITFTATPGRWDELPKAVGRIRAATAKDGHLTLDVEITGGLLTVREAEQFTDHPEGAGAGLTMVKGPRGRDVKTIREVYPLPAVPARPAGPQCSPDCPHHAYPDGAAAKLHERNQARAAAARPKITLEDDHG